MAKQVTIYSTPTCTYCKHVKEFFKEHNVAYEEFDVATDKDKRAEMVDKSGQLGVPVTVIDDQVIVGYDESTLKQILNIA
jgi:glutaredoxin-like YruB-family protein